MTKQLEAYRTDLVAAERKAYEDYDKAILTLAGGALGVSFAFVKDIIGPRPLSYPGLLLWAWAAWGASLACVLWSLYTSGRAFRRAVAQVDEQTIHTAAPGGWSNTLTGVLNLSGGLLFLGGLVLMGAFVSFNLR